MGKTVLRISLLLALFLAVPAGGTAAAGGSLFFNDGIGDEQLLYRISFGSGDTHVYDTYSFKRTASGDRPCYEILVSSTGEDGERITQEIRLTCPDLKPLRVHYLKTAGDGKNGREEFTAAFKGDKVEFNASGKDKILKAPNDTYLAAVHVLRGFPFGGAKRVSFNVFYYQPGITQYYAENKGLEKVRVPAGEFECYRIESGATGMASLMVPKAQYWYAREGSHVLVKYTGKKMGGNQQTWELAKVQSGGR